MSLSVQPFAASSAPSTTASSVVVRSSVVSVYDDLHCAECNTGDHIIVDYHTGTNICTECGMVIGGQIISEESEWRSFSDGDKKRGSDPNRVGGPDNPNLGDGTLATMIGRDSDGKWSSKQHCNGRLMHVDVASRSLLLILFQCYTCLLPGTLFCTCVCRYGECTEQVSERCLTVCPASPAAARLSCRQSIRFTAELATSHY